MSLEAAVPSEPAEPAPEAPTEAGAAPEGGWRVARLLAPGVLVAAAGVPLGLVWTQLAPDVPVRVTGEGVAFADAQPEQVVAADAWFTLLAAGFGVLAAVLVWRLTRTTRGVSGLVALVVGAVAAGVGAWLVGRQVGLAGYQAALAAAEPGAALQRPPDLRVAETGWWPPWVAGAPLVPALLAAATYTLLAAWSRYPGLGRGSRSTAGDLD